MQCTSNNKSAQAAKSPFNHPTADIVFQTCDNVDFHLHKSILSIASTWFDSTLIISHDPSCKEPIAPTPVSEDSETLDALMRLCYPVADPVLDGDLLLVGKVLEAALKYELEEAIALTRSVLCSFIEAQPLAVFAVACRLHLEEEAKVAAGTWKRKFNREASQTLEAASFDLSLAGASYVPEMSSISAASFLRLLDFLRNDGDARYHFSEAGCPEQCAAALSKDADSAEEDQNTVCAPIKDEDVLLRAYDEVNVPAHRFVLDFSSEKLLVDEARSQDPQGHEVYRVDANAQILTILVRLCYPFAKPSLRHLKHYDAVLTVASKYEMNGVILLVKDYCIQNMRVDPLLVYFLAAKYEWQDALRPAAKLVVEGNAQCMYAPIMEGVPAHLYVQLLRFCHEYIAALTGVVNRHAKATGSFQWRKVVSSEGAVPPRVYLSLVEQSSTRGVCYSCVPAYNKRSGEDCSCRVDEFTGLIKQSKVLQDDLEEALGKIDLNAPV